MIRKDPNFKYKVKFVKRFKSRNDKPMTRFTISEFDRRTNTSADLNVMAFFDIDLQDGDEVTFKDYMVGVHSYKGHTYATMYINEGDIEIVNMVNDGQTIDISDELPFALMMLVMTIYHFNRGLLINWKSRD